MRVVDSLVRRFKQTRRNDPIFGSMLYMGDRLRYWEGKTSFTPTGSIIEVFIDGSVEDDMEQQRAFFERLVQEWPDIHKGIGKIVVEKLREQMPDLAAESSWDSFRVSSLSIPKASFQDAGWEMSFAPPSDPNHLWTVYLKGRQVQNLVIDG